MKSWDHLGQVPRSLDKSVDMWNYPMWFDINQEIICKFNCDFICLKTQMALI